MWSGEGSQAWWIDIMIVADTNKLRYDGIIVAHVRWPRFSPGIFGFCSIAIFAIGMWGGG